MTRIHAAGAGLLALTLLSMLSATVPGPLAAAVILAAAAVKAAAVLVCFLRLDAAAGGWRFALPGFVVALLLVVATLRLAGPAMVGS